MGFLSGLFGGGSKNNPANAAMPYLNQTVPMAQQNLGPWQNQGQTAQTQNANRYSSLVNDPGAEYEKLMSGYKPSAGFDFKNKNYQTYLEGVGAANGNANGPGEQAAQLQLKQSLMQEDEDNYYDKIYNLLNMGVTGNEAVAGRGFNAATDLTNITGTNNSEKAGFAYKGKENENQTRNDMSKLIMQIIGGGAGAFLGGPMGAITGANIAGGKLPYPNSGKPSNSTQFGKGIPWLGGNF